VVGTGVPRRSWHSDDLGLAHHAIDVEKGVLSVMPIPHHLTVGPLDHELRTAGNEGQDSGKSWQECVESVRGICLGLYVPYGVTSYTAPDGSVL